MSLCTPLWHEQNEVFAYIMIDNVTLTDTGPSGKLMPPTMISSRLSTRTSLFNSTRKSAIYIFLSCLSTGMRHAHARARDAFEVIQQERILQNKDTLTLFTHGIIMLGSPIGTATYTRDSAITTAPFSP